MLTVLPDHTAETQGQKGVGKRYHTSGTGDPWATGGWRWAEHPGAAPVAA